MPQSKDFPDCFYRVTIKGLCVRDGKLLMMREAKGDGKENWELPGGGLDFGEDVFLGFKREIAEETGLTVTNISKQPVYIWTHKFLYRRSMEWFYSLIIGYRVEFSDLNFTPSDECVELRFVSGDELATLPRIQMCDLHTIFNPQDFMEDF